MYEKTDLGVDRRTFLSHLVPLRDLSPSSAKYILTLTGSARQKTQLFGQNFPKNAQNRFLTCFFQNLSPAHTYGRNWICIVFWECLQNYFGRPKKIRPSLNDY